MTSRVVVVDDEPSMSQLIEDDLGRRGIEVLAFFDPKEALGALDEEEVGAVLTDFRMPEMDGTELCRRVAEKNPAIPVIVMTAFGSLETAVEAIRAGAFDFVTKPIEMDLLAIAVERALRHRALEDRVKVLSEEVERSQRLGDLLGESESMRRLFDQIQRLADSEATILISGDSGTGKELVARALHRGSRRRRGPLVSVNCAALPENLLESELFGHARGAFTGAQTAREGLFAKADRGTLYLDEVGELPLSLQPKLLRALEEGRVRPVGSDQEVPFDARLVAATNRDLEQLVEEDRFRQDLFYRINVIEIQVPPLCARGNDVLLLAQHFVSEFAEKSGKEPTGLSEAVAKRLLAYDWPGNVRELKNAMERAVALTRLDRIAVDDLPQKIRRHEPTGLVVAGSEPADLEPLETVERRYILHTLKVLGGNKTMAARALGCDRKTLYRKLKSYGIEEE
ncbi:MAG: sigma-54-dependent transcriptional regulator [Thermoanaerobaculia bacterium]